MKTYLTNRISVAWVCEICDSARSVEYCWPKPVIIDDSEIQKIANFHHLESSPKCCGTPTFDATRDGIPLQEYRMSRFQKATLIGWILFPVLAMAAIALVFLLTRG